MWIETVAAIADGKFGRYDVDDELDRRLIIGRALPEQPLLFFQPAY